ncbi:hypothetical protein B0J12DRAFT_738322 [Macrophomina phaseolina]|uniref:Zn(2)-C6 fungal-type domain-containing protein n=1 Tax=Macrophomina phaseolina TaxID=35725 RepID=A0ABQ8GGK8_9PEZI|nr:hypothetical protein B0J12DRAFT_738322 [Macrophomina phaseolina]
MSDNVGWTPRRNREISYEEGLAMIDNFYDGSVHFEPLQALDTHTATAMNADLKHVRIAAQAREADDARTAAAIAQLSHSPFAHSKDSPTLPTSPPLEHPPQWQPQWNQNRSLAFTSSPVAVSSAPPQTPIMGFPMTTASTPFVVASHARAMPSSLQSMAPSPDTITSKTDSPAFASSKETSPIFSASNTASPSFSTSMAGSPTLTDTPTPVLTPALARTNSNSILTPTIPRANAPAMPSSSSPKSSLPYISPSALPKKESAPNKVAKKHATDSPTASTTSAPARVPKKSRCIRCVKQHGACDLDFKRPCDRCAKAGLSAAGCVPREYKRKKEA